MNVEELANRSYVPYSGNPEHAAVRGKSGGLYPGIRIENISFPLTIPAIQCAMVICLSEGERPETLYLSDSLIEENPFPRWEEEFNLNIKKLTEIDGEATEVLDTTGDYSDLLKRLLKRARAPHSDFPVSSLLETERGVITGVNIEFNAWETGLCAERVAIAKALAYGIAPKDITAMHLHAPNGEYSSPCGACRQVIIEHLPRIPILIHHPDGTRSRHFSYDLLPYSFKSDFLKKNS